MVTTFGYERKQDNLAVGGIRFEMDTQAETNVKWTAAVNGNDATAVITRGLNSS